MRHAAQAQRYKSVSVYVGPGLLQPTQDSRVIGALVQERTWILQGYCLVWIQRKTLAREHVTTQPCLDVARCKANPLIIGGTVTGVLAG